MPADATIVSLRSDPANKILGLRVNTWTSLVTFVGVVIFLLAWLLLGPLVAIGFLIGSILSGLAGYIGMNVSVRANVRTAQAATHSLARGLDIAFKSGAVTGMLVGGVAPFGLSDSVPVLDPTYNGTDFGSLAGGSFSLTTDSNNVYLGGLSGRLPPPYCRGHSIGDTGR